MTDIVNGLKFKFTRTEVLAGLERRKLKMQDHMYELRKTIMDFSQRIAAMKGADLGNEKTAEKYQNLLVHHHHYELLVKMHEKNIENTNVMIDRLADAAVFLLDFDDMEGLLFVEPLRETNAAKELFSSITGESMRNIKKCFGME